MKKVFVIVMDYKENTESMFTDVGVECSFDNQLFDLKEKGHIESYENTDAYEIKEDQLDLLVLLAQRHSKFSNY